MYSKISPTLNARDSHEPRYILEEVKIIGQMDNTLDNTFESANRVYDKNGLCPTIPTCAGGGHQPKVIIEDIHCVAMRGRNPEHPTDRTPGIHSEQRLEMNKAGLVNTLTTVQKDNLLLEKKIQKVGQISNDGSQYGTVISEDGLCSTLTAGTHGYANNCISVKQATKEGTIKCKVGGCYDASYPDSKTRRGRVQEGGDITPTITAQGGENINFVETVYRIRKLTPRETWRLMGYTDTDFEKTAEVNSNTQLYRESGNAIVKQVMMAIFLQMGIKGLKKWEERSEEEKAELIRGSIYDKADFQ